MTCTRHSSWFWPRSGWSWPLSLVLIALTTTLSGGALAQTITVGGSGVGVGIFTLLGAAYQERRPGIRIKVLQSLGSAGGIKAARAGAIDLGFSARPLNSDEQAGALWFPIADTAMVFVTSKLDHGLDMTTAKLLEIYSKHVSTWPDGREIRAILRPAHDSTTVMLRTIAPEVAAAVDAIYQEHGLAMAATDQEALDLAEHLPGSLTLNSLLAVRAERRKLAVLPLNGVAATPETITSGRYPLRFTLFAILKPSPRPEVSDFADFVQSPAGEKMLRENGAVAARTTTRNQIP